VFAQAVVENASVPKSLPIKKTDMGLLMLTSVGVEKVTEISRWDSAEAC